MYVFVFFANMDDYEASVLSFTTPTNIVILTTQILHGSLLLMTTINAIVSSTKISLSLNSTLHFPSVLPSPHFSMPNLTP